MNIVYDLIEPQVLINYVRAFDNEVLRPTSNIRVLEEWLPELTTEDLEVRVRKGALLDVNVAEFRAFDTPTRFQGRQGTKFVRGSLGPLSWAIPLGEEEILRQRALDQGTNDPIIEQIYADSENAIRAVQARIELARGDIIDDGVVTISENGLELEADFGRTISDTAGTVWTDTTAPMLSELLAFTQTYVDTNGIEPGGILMAKRRVANIALNEEMRSYAAISGSTPTRLNRATIDVILENEGLPPILLYDGQVRVNKTATRILPAEKIYFMPPDGEPLGATLFGTTAEALKLRSKGLIDREEAPGIVAVIMENDEPVQTITKGVGLALPIMPNPNLVMDVVVAS